MNFDLHLAGTNFLRQVYVAQSELVLLFQNQGTHFSHRLTPPVSMERLLRHQAVSRGANSVSVEATIERESALSKRTIGISQSNVIGEAIILGA
jgi:hypothetical protein